MAGEMDKKQILKISGKKQFLEVMANCINIDRLYINFEDYDDTKPRVRGKDNRCRYILICWMHMYWLKIYSRAK